MQNAWIKSWVIFYCLFNIFRVGRAAERARRHPRETNTRNVTIWSGNCWEITSNSVQENILLYYNRKYFISTRIMLSFLSDTPYDSTPYLLPGNKPGNLLKCSRNYSYLKIFCTSFFHFPGIKYSISSCLKYKKPKVSFALWKLFYNAMKPTW